MSMKPRSAMTAFILAGSAFLAIAQNTVPEKETIHYDQIDGALIYDHDPSTKLGDDVFGTIIADLKNYAPGRCSHGGPVCLEYPNGHVLAFYANTTDHNSDSWSDYALSKDGGKSWSKQERAYVDKKVRDPELAYLGGKYYLHGRSGQYGEGRDRFVLYQSDDGVTWATLTCSSL